MQSSSSGSSGSELYLLLKKHNVLANLCLQQLQTNGDMKNFLYLLNESLDNLNAHLLKNKKLDDDTWDVFSRQFGSLMGSVIILLIQNHDMVKAEDLGRKSLAVFEKIQANRQYNKVTNRSAVLGQATQGYIAHLSGCMGSILLLNNKIDEAGKFLKKSYEFINPKRRPAKKSSSSIKNLINYISGQSFPLLAQVAALRGRENKARKFAALSRNFYESCKEKEIKYFTGMGLAGASSSIVDIYLEKGQYREGILWSEFAMEVAREQARLARENPDINTLDLKYGPVNILEMNVHLDVINELIESFKQKIKDAEMRIAASNYTIIKNSLETSEIAAKSCLVIVAREAIIEFDDKTQAEIIIATLNNGKLLFSVVEDKIFEVDLLSVDAAYLKILMKKCLKNLAINSLPHAPSVKSSPEPHFNWIMSEEGKTYKQEKWERHTKKQSLREKEADIPLQGHSCASAPSKKKKKTKLVWNSEEYNHSHQPIYKMHGRPSILTFSTFSEDAFDKVRDQATVAKCQAVAAGGNVISSEKNRGNQGTAFNLGGTHFQEKYGKDYICKLKILGARGAGNHRFLGRKATTGTFFSKEQGRKWEKTPCELVVFDKYVHNGHKRHK